MQARCESRFKLQQVSAVLFGANLNLVATLQQIQFESQRPQVFKARLPTGNGRIQITRRTPDRLEVDVMLEQRSSHTRESLQVLPHRCVLNLNHIDVVLMYRS